MRNKKAYTEKLDEIANTVEKFSKEAALEIDKISDLIEGKEANTIKFDESNPDQVRYMKDRFNSDVRKRDSDEPFMDEYNKNNFEQVIDVKKSPVPVKKASAPYQKI